MTASSLSSQCTATSRRSGQRCQHMVIGGGVCHLHGGKAPQVAAAREARIVAWEAAQGQDPIEVRDPADALMAAATLADELVQRLHRDLRERGTLNSASLMALGDGLDRVGRLSKVVIDARIDERKVRLSEAQGVQMHRVLVGVLTDLGHDVSPGSEAAQVVLRHLAPLRAGSLRVIEGGPGGCPHEGAQPVTLATGEVVAAVCPTCFVRLPQSFVAAGARAQGAAS